MSTPTVPSAGRAPLDAQLMDLISEALAWTDDAVQRAQVLAEIVDCALEAMCWRVQPEGSPQEELSAEQVRLAARQHLAAMQRAAEQS